MKIKAQAAAAATAWCSRLPFPNYARLIIRSRKGLMMMGCAGFITLALITVLCISTPRALSFFPAGGPPPNIRTLFGMLHVSPFEEDDVDEGNLIEYESRIKQVFEKAAMPNRTVILTTLNGAWANQSSMVNLFLESFWIGYGTQRLLRHLIFICVDDKAYEQCLVIHPHCLRIKTHDVDLSEEQILLSTNYIKLVWRRIKFLKTVIKMNFNFIFTDTDVLWFRDPFPLLEKDRKFDIQISSDQYNKKPWDIHNKPNTGFMYVQANERTLSFFNYWYEERKRNSSLATQGILNIIKFEDTFKKIGMDLHFLDPQLFGGFCRIKHTDMTKSITMHATCCKGLEAKIIDLRMILKGWKKWQQVHTLLEITHPIKKSTLPPSSCNLQNHEMSPHFDIPSACKQSMKS